jgi:hypothetical protein
MFVAVCIIALTQRGNAMSQLAIRLTLAANMARDPDTRFPAYWREQARQAAELILSRDLF